jgi:hypothetical protein
MLTSECGWKGGNRNTRPTKARERRIPMSSFDRKTFLRLASRAVKAQDQLAALGLDRPTDQPNETHIRTKETMNMNLPNHKIP